VREPLEIEGGKEEAGTGQEYLKEKGKRRENISIHCLI
jgi:hypothetical protein